jgi:hypothetical protein
VIFLISPRPAASAERGETKRILLLHSFSRDFKPWSDYARSIKAELEQQSVFRLEIQSTRRYGSTIRSR